MIKLGIIAIALLLATPGLARERCAVRVVRNVSAEEAPESVMEKGQAGFGPITQLRVNKKTGKMIFCAHGSYCYAAAAFEFVSPCRFEPNAFADPQDFYFSAQ